jgi:molecular chaperone DnaJ
MDHYALLGVTPAASRSELERAYRRLSRRYHPGVNPGDGVAEAMYRRIQEAFAVLGDEYRRRQYDSGHRPSADLAAAAVAFEGFDFSAPAEGALAATFSELFADVFQDAAREATTPTRGGDVTLAIRVRFVDAMRGCQVPLSVTRLDRCPACGGTAQAPSRAMTCATCDGQGARRWARGHMVFSRTCEHCQGTGQAADPCRSCRGSGVASRTEVVTLQIPAGLEDGARLAVPGHGHAGARGGPMGDLYVEVEVGDDRVFRRAGRDLQVRVPLRVDEAVLGALITVPALDGPIDLEVPPGSRAGDVLRVPGHGVPGRSPGDAGDLVVTLEIALPAAIDSRSRELIREFGRLNRDDVRRGLFS